MRKRWISWACWHWNLHNKIACTVMNSWAISKSLIPSSWKRTMHIVRSNWIRAMDRTQGVWRSDIQEPDDQQNKEITNHVALELTTNAQKSWAVWALIAPELVYRRIVLNPLVIFHTEEYFASSSNWQLLLCLRLKQKLLRPGWLVGWEWESVCIQRGLCETHPQL